VGGEVGLDPSYSGNPLVNAMALGLMENRGVVCFGGGRVGNPVSMWQHHAAHGMAGPALPRAELSAASSRRSPRRAGWVIPFLEKEFD